MQSHDLNHLFLIRQTISQGMTPLKSKKCDLNQTIHIILFECITTSKPGRESVWDWFSKNKNIITFIFEFI